MLKAYPVPGKAKSAMLCQAFIDGAPKSAKGSVFSGVKAGNFEDWKRVRASGEDWYFIDNSYFDGASRGVQFRVTKNRLQHTGLGESTGERFSRLGIAIEPWVSRPDGYALVIEQSPDHMRYTLGLSGYWHKEKVHGPIKVRPWSADKPKIQTALRQDLDGARILYTHTSAAAVTGALAGVPVVCDPQCAAYLVNPWDMDERLQWASVLADNQFTINEMKEGLAWRTLNP